MRNNFKKQCHLFRQPFVSNKTQSHKKVCENKDFCNVFMPSKGTKVLELNQYHKSTKPSFIIYADLASLIEKTDGHKNKPEESSTTKVSEHVPSGFSMSIISSFKDVEKRMMYADIKIA